MNYEDSFKKIQYDQRLEKKRLETVQQQVSIYLSILYMLNYISKGCSLRYEIKKMQFLGRKKKFLSQNIFFLKKWEVGHL